MPFYDIYNKYYLVTFFVFILVETLLCSGITYGWASIVVVFKLEYFYLGLCKTFYAEHNITFPNVNVVHRKSSVARGGGGGGGDDSGILYGCPAQDRIFNLIFTISIYCVTGIKLLTGIFIDKYGPRVARIVGGYVCCLIIYIYYVLLSE